MNYFININNRNVHEQCIAVYPNIAQCHNTLTLHLIWNNSHVLVSSTLSSLTPTLPLLLFFLTLGEGRSTPCMSTGIWEQATWKQIKPLNELALISEPESIDFCLAACCFHSCTFYPPYRLDSLLRASGRQPDEGLKHDPNISILRKMTKYNGARSIPLHTWFLKKSKHVRSGRCNAKFNINKALPLTV